MVWEKSTSDSRFHGHMIAKKCLYDSLLEYNFPFGARRQRQGSFYANTVFTRKKSLKRYILESAVPLLDALDDCFSSFFLLRPFLAEA